MARCIADIKAGDHYYIINDVTELCDVLEFYTSDAQVDPHHLVGKAALILESPQLLSDTWDGCILLQFETESSASFRCKLPLAALDMCREHHSVEKIPTSAALSEIPAQIYPDNVRNNTATVNKKSPKRNRKNTPLSPESSAALSKIFYAAQRGELKKEFDDESNTDSATYHEKEIKYVRDPSSESAMIRQLAAESIQDAYR
jgi:hypothetical protein